MEFITLVKRWARLHKGEFSPVICQDDSFIMFVHTLDDYGWNSYALQNQGEVSPGAKVLSICYLTRCFRSACSYAGRSQMELMFL